MQTIEAVEQAAREVIEAYGNYLWKGVTCDRTAAPLGGLNPRVAYLLGISTSAARDRVLKLVGQGKVLRHRSNRGACLRWWPVGLFEKLQAERAAAA